MDEPSPVTDHSVSEGFTESLTQLTIQQGNGSEKLQVTLDHDHEDSSPGQGAQAESNACSDDMTHHSTSDAKEVSRQRRADQGDLECEVWAEGSEGTREWKECTKYPGHEQFIPVSKFSLKHLPKAYRNQKYLDGILAFSRMTVRVRSRYISEARPDGYPFSKHRGERFTITGSGLVQKRICAPDVVNSEVLLASAEHGREDQYDCSASAALPFASDVMGAKQKSTEFCPKLHKKCKSMIAKLLYSGRSHSDDYSVDNNDVSAKLLGLEEDTEGDTIVQRWLLTYNFQCQNSIKQFLINEFADDPSAFDPELLNHDDYVRQFFLWSCWHTYFGKDELDVYFDICRGDHSSEAEHEVEDVEITGMEDGWKDKEDKCGRGNRKEKGRPREEDAYSNSEQVEKTNDEWENGEEKEEAREEGNEEDGEEDGDEDAGPDNETFGYVHPCSCPDCTEYDSPKPTGYYLNVITARHVVFDSKEAKNTVVDLFYDQDGQGIKKQLHGVDMQLSHPAGDWAILKCVTHDYSLVCELRKLMSKLTKRVECMKEKWIDHPLAIICSHPHGLPKHITVGKWTNRKYYYDDDISNEDFIETDDDTFLSGMWTSYVYDTPTCHGSSGAAVLILGYEPGTMFINSTFHPHYGVHSLEQGLNKSGTFISSLHIPDYDMLVTNQCSAKAQIDSRVTWIKAIIDFLKRVQSYQQRLALEQIKKDIQGRKSSSIRD